MKADAIEEILKDLKTTLGTTEYSYYNEIAPDEAAYPFITYEVDNSFTDGDATETVFVYLDFWDIFSRTGSTVGLENMMTDVVKLLYRRKVVVEDTLSFRYILDKRRWIRDPEDDIRHRRGFYQIRVFGKE